jgi:hypothetical protein
LSWQSKLRAYCLDRIVQVEAYVSVFEILLVTLWQVEGDYVESIPNYGEPA